MKFQNDTIIYPIVSTQFGEKNLKHETVEYNQTDLYLKDQIGLKKLLDENKVYLTEILNADHQQFKDVHILEDFIPFMYERNWIPHNPTIYP